MAADSALAAGFAAFGFEASASGPLRVVPIECIQPNPRQPRRSFDPRALQVLAATIDACGLLAPPPVRDLGETYQLVAGERRWRACQLLGWSAMPVLVLGNDASDASELAAALAENIARDDLNPVDEALALVTLLEDLGVTQEGLGRSIGRSQEAISNSIRLLNLPDQVLVLLERRELTVAHGKVLLSEPEHHKRITLARRAVAGRWTVRRLQAEISAASPRATTPTLPADMLDAADRWTEVLRARTGHAMTIRATASGFQIDVGDQHAVRALLKHLGITAADLDE